MSQGGFDDIFQGNAGYVDEQFRKYAQDPQSVPPEWRSYFEGFHAGFGTALRLDALDSGGGSFATAPTRPSLGAGAGAGVGPASNAGDSAVQMRAVRMVDSYFRCGHLKAKVNPLFPPPAKIPAFEPEAIGLSPADDGTLTHAGALIGLPPMPIGQLRERLEELFCGPVGAEFAYVRDPVEREWLIARFIAARAARSDAATKRQLFADLARADALEKTIATKYIGKKRFSIEGSDAQIPLLETIIDAAAERGVADIGIGMAHRGRLNVLVNIAGKPYETLFAEFEGKPNPAFPGDADVKYHSGYESSRNSRNGHAVHVSVSYNPSHLEFVSAVVLGEVRARQDVLHGGDRLKAIAIVLHGDAAFAGQGVVFEAMQFAALPGYTSAGSIHVVANNQVGFTTNPEDARSSAYASDVAKVVTAPVFHVNADDLEAVHQIGLLAVEYRQKFKRDIVIDLICFRRHGHNETDEPNFTQPVLYKLIKDKPAPVESYLRTLVADGTAGEGELREAYAQIKAPMDAAFDLVKKKTPPFPIFAAKRRFADFKHAGEADMLKPVQTGVAVDELKRLGEAMLSLPEGFTPNAKIGRIILAERKEMLSGAKKVDWGMGELLAYASLLNEGKSVRLSGQDVRRGTFSHRHVTLTDAETGKRHLTLLPCVKEGARVEVIDSPLSEVGTMGFEYGYATEHPDALVLWEGQFGDFVNGAQVIVDQFIAAGETKWCQQQALVLLLPHGFEGQGPEHSSARLERFLQLSAQGNMQVCYFSNVANLFHAFRRQLARPYRKPMVVMTPKSFLRAARASCDLADLATGAFKEVLDDPRSPDPAKVRRVVLCSGKIGLDLFDALEGEAHSKSAAEVAVVRVEQLAPFPKEAVLKALGRYGKAKEVVWAQEEPRNMGAYAFVWPRLEALVSELGNAVSLFGATRSERASPAVGLEKLHLLEQEKLMAAAITAKQDTAV